MKIQNFKKILKKEPRDYIEIQITNNENSELKK